MLESISRKITAIVLAGGESSRMGRDKALLEVNNQTLLARICSIALEVSQQVYVVTPRIEKYRSILPPGCQLIEEELVLEAKSNTPIIGFALALPSVNTEWVLLLACDLPYLSSFQVKQWSEVLATVLPTEIALLPRSVKGWEALCGFYRRESLNSLEIYLKQGGKSFQGWLASHLVRELVVSDRRCLFNCNTPRDWQIVKDQILIQSRKDARNKLDLNISSAMIKKETRVGNMKRVAVFGNAGGGKSTLSKRLAEITGLPLIALDLIQYKPGGEKVPDEEYKTIHEEILQQDCWIIDGFGSLDTVWKRLEAADTLVYLDLPVLQHYFWITKRLIKGFWVTPEGYPENSPLFKSTLNAYYIVWLCHKKLTPKYRAYVEQAKNTKQVYHLRSPKDIAQFCKHIDF